MTFDDVFQNIKIRMKRKLTEEERKRLIHKRPWFGGGRVLANRDLEADEAEVLRFVVRRLWDLNECQPPCCPRELLVQTVDDRFIHLESWSVLPSENEIGCNCVAHRTLASNTLLAFETAGDTVIVEQGSVRDSFLDFERSECDWVEVTDLPATFRRTLELA